ncbi:MAG: gephyrin-like molybdotransferase Glp [Chloroflexota bacterium]
MFFNVVEPTIAQSLLAERLPRILPSESIPLEQALDRLCSETITAPHSLPFFRRSTMDGYAVRAVDTHGASESLPTLLTVRGEVLMGQPTAIKLSVGETAVIHTGGELPPDADAVVRVEDTRQIMLDEVEVNQSVSSGENVIQVGEDIEKGQTVLEAGHQLRPQDLGGLAALGIQQLRVVRKPSVAIISTGDELVPYDQIPRPGQVRDINSLTLASMVTKVGAEPIAKGIIPDDLDLLSAVIGDSVEEADIVVISAGSSVSVRDATLKAMQRIPGCDVLFHGVAVKPGKPTVGAIANGRPVIGLPGNPVSAMNLFALLVIPTIKHLMGAKSVEKATVSASLARNVASAPGREDYISVRLESRDGEIWAEPVFGKSNLIYTLIHADGTIVIPADKSGLTRGEFVSVSLF